MMLWSLLLAGLLGAGAEQTPNQSLSIENVQAPEDSTPRTPATTTQPSHEPSKSIGEIKITPRSQSRTFFTGSGDSDTQPTANSASRQRTIWWVTTAMGLVVVLGVIVASSKILRRFVPGLGAAYGDGPIHLLYRTHLGPKQSLCLIRCGSSLYLVGVTAEHMHTLAEITDPEEIDFIKGQCMQVRPNSASKAFRAALHESERKARNDPPPTPMEQAAVSPTRTTPEELTRQLGQLRERILTFKNKAQT